MIIKLNIRSKTSLSCDVAWVGIHKAILDEKDKVLTYTGFLF